MMMRQMKMTYMLLGNNKDKEEGRDKINMIMDRINKIREEEETLINMVINYHLQKNNQINMEMKQDK